MSMIFSRGFKEDCEREDKWSFRKEYIELQKYTKDLVKRLNEALKSCGDEDYYYHLMTEADSYINQGNCNICRHMITTVLGDSEFDTEEEVSGCNISPDKCHWEPKE